MIDPPCDFDPCAEDLECIDVTLNGTVWNETYWYDWFATEYEDKEYDNFTYAYQCIDPTRPIPCDSDPCANIKNSVCIDVTLESTVWDVDVWIAYLWENYRIEYDFDTEGYECYVEPPLPCTAMVCNKFEVIFST
jgi:hypothetical protein